MGCALRRLPIVVAAIIVVVYMFLGAKIRFFLILQGFWGKIIVYLLAGQTCHGDRYLT